MRALGFSLVLVSLAIAIACGGGGGGGSESSSSSDDSGFQIKLLNADRTNNKLVLLSDDAPFRIFSDQSNRTDPTEATHVRVNVYDSEDVLQRTAEKALTRFSDPPYDVDQTTRFINIPNPPSGNIRIEVELGQDFGVASSNTRSEVVYYTGSTNVYLSGNVAIIDGAQQTTIPVIIRNVVDEESGLYSIQGYLDFVNYPVLISEVSEEDLFNTDLSLPLTTFSVIDTNLEESANVSLGNTSYIASNIKLAEVDEPLSYFFEVLNISSNFVGFSVASETGSPLNFVLRGYVAPSESTLGIPVLIDWETTWAKIMTDWYVFMSESDPDLVISDDYETNYNAMSNIFVNHMEELLLPPTTGNTYQEPYVVKAQELYLTEVTFTMFSILNEGDKLSDTSNPSRFNVKGVTSSQGTSSGVNYFFLSTSSDNNLEVDRLARSIRVDLEFSDETIDVPVSPESDILLDSDREPVIENGQFVDTVQREANSDEFVLSDEFNSSVRDISYNQTSLLNYLHSLLLQEINSD